METGNRAPQENNSGQGVARRPHAGIAIIAIYREPGHAQRHIIVLLVDVPAEPEDKD